MTVDVAKCKIPTNNNLIFTGYERYSGHKFVCEVSINIYDILHSNIMSVATEPSRRDVIDKQNNYRYWHLLLKFVDPCQILHSDLRPLNLFV